MAAPNATRPATLLADVVDALARRERTLWAAVAVTCVLDIALTAYGLSQGFQEANPVARATMLHFGPLAAMVALKTVVLLVAGVFTRYAPPGGRPLIPLAVAMPWAVASVSNSFLIFG